MTLQSARKQYWLFLHSDNNAIPLQSSLHNPRLQQLESNQLLYCLTAPFCQKKVGEKYLYQLPLLSVGHHQPDVHLRVLEKVKHVDILNIWTFNSNTVSMLEASSFEYHSPAELIFTVPSINLLSSQWVCFTLFIVCLFPSRHFWSIQIFKSSLLGIFQNSGQFKNQNIYKSFLQNY